MKIKSVRYERLFNLGEYQHETIGFIADVDENEKPEQVLAKLFQMVTEANKKIKIIRDVAGKIFSLQQEDHYCYSIAYTKHEIEKANRILTDLKKDNKYKKKDSPENRQFKRYSKEIQENSVELKRKQNEEKQLMKQYQQMVADFKKGIL